MVGYWSGTKFFLGELHRAQQRWIMPVALAITLVCYLVWDAMPSLLAPGSAAILGVVMVWCGQRLIRNKNRYQFLGVTLLLRGVFNVLSAVTLGPELYLFWFVGTTVLKTLSMLGLIYAVQDEIQQRYARTIDSLSNGFLIRDRRGYVQVANERCALAGLCRTGRSGGHVSDLLPGLTPQMADEYFQRFMAPGAVYPVETAMFQLHDGTRLPVELLASPYEERGRLYCLVQLLDISERTRKDDLLRQAANIDPVTGYFNRHAITNRLKEEVTLACSGDCECAVLLSISTSSSASTIPSAMPWATSCCASLRAACIRCWARKMYWPVSAAMNSSWCCPSWRPALPSSRRAPAPSRSSRPWIIASR
jgi:PAS domain S-box-containing protein